MVDKCLIFDLEDFPSEIKRSFVGCADAVLDDTEWPMKQVVIWPLSLSNDLTVAEEEDFNEVYRFMAAEAGRNIVMQDFVVIRISDE